MSEKVKIVYACMDYKAGHNKIKVGEATIDKDGVAHIFAVKPGDKSFNRALGEWLAYDTFSHDWQLAITDIVKAKMKEDKCAEQ